MSRKSTTSTFIVKAKKIHGDRYDYSKVEYVNNHTKVCIICPKHGEFWQTPSNHLNKTRPRGCPACGIEITNLKNTYSKEEFIEKAILKHGGRFDYSKIDYKGSDVKVCIICPKHGEFWQTPASHLQGCGCPYCSGNAKDDKNSFIEKAHRIHGDKYDYSKINYINSQTPVEIICPEHGSFWQLPNNHLSKGHDCPECFSNYSKAEEEIIEFISDIIGEEKNIIRNSKKIIPPYELDIYIPSLSLAIEFNGLRWHSEMFIQQKTYHLIKTMKCADLGIRLLHIFEDEWEFKKEVVKDIIKKNITNMERVYARKCTISEISNDIYKEFINANHIQGYVSGFVKFGLYYNDELVSVMSFSKQRLCLGAVASPGNYELLRYASKLGTTVVGGFSKLLKHFIRQYNPAKIISYCDIRLFEGKVYEKAGFRLYNISKPNYFYVVGKHRENRFKYRKDILIAQGFDRNKTEHQIMLERGIYRIYDCGCKCYILEC